MKSNDRITIDRDILGGTPVSSGPRVPVKTLFEYPEDNYTLEEFLECFPTVTRDMAVQMLRAMAAAKIAAGARMSNGATDGLEEH